MMSKKQWSAMLCFHISYLFLGATVFYNIQNPLELAERSRLRTERFEILSLLQQNYAPGNTKAYEELIGKLSDYCDRIMTNNTESEDPVVIWNFYHSFFFSYTVVSTIGYGNIAPTTKFGRIFMIFYAIIGIPYNGIMFANLGAYFATTFRNMYKKYKLKNPKSGSNIDYQLERLGLFGRITLYLLPGIFVFLVLPAIWFSYFEDWDYVLAFYYAFVTLTTIGFGDFVASFGDYAYGQYTIIYQIFLICWITFGLGYLVMIVGFLTQGLKSKRIKQLEHIVAQNIKQTQSKIWTNVTKDIGYLRGLLNEAYLMRFKPVYHDEVIAPRYHRSSSCPSLYIGEEDSPKTPRRRANSEAMPAKAAEIHRVQSDTDLLAIDRNRTFAVNAIIQPAELLAKVVNALGNLHDEDAMMEDGIHGFSDDDILASEKLGSSWSMGGEKFYAQPPKVPRERAASEIRFTSTEKPDKYYNNNEWTWSSSVSSGKMRDILIARKFAKMSVPNVSTSMKSIDAIDSKHDKSFLSKMMPFKKSSKSSKVDSSNSEFSDMTPSEYLKQTARGRISLAANPQRYVNKTKGGRASMASLPPNNELLENTTIADLIRALTTLHTADAMSPPRKLGTASFTPPSSLQNISEDTPSSLGSRRFSVHPTPNLERHQSNASMHLPPAAARRRFSLHPVSNNGAPFTPTRSPLAAGLNQPRRGSLLNPFPSSQSSESPSSIILGRRRLSSGAGRFAQLNTGTPSPRLRRPFQPQNRIVEDRGSITNNENLTDVKVEKSTPKRLIERL